MRALIVLRRARRDGVLLVVVAVLVGFAIALATILPKLVTDAVDAGSRAAVAAAGADADIVVRTTVGHSPGGAPAATFAELTSLADALPGRLPQALKGGVGTPTVSVSSEDAAGVVANEAATPTHLSVQFAAVGDDAQRGLQLIAGRLPQKNSGEIEVVISREAAEVALIDVGTKIAFTKIGGGSLTATVVGVVASSDESAREWRDLRRMWLPTSGSRTAAGSGVSIVALTTPGSLDRAQSLFLETYAATVRVPLVVAWFTAERVSLVAGALRGLELKTSDLAGDFPAAVNVHSDFEDALADFPERSRAAIAQSSLLIASVLGVAVAVLAQLGLLLAVRRTGDLALERARGVALGTVAAGALIESAPIVIIGGTAGLLVAGLLFTGDFSPTPASIFVALAAVLAPPVQAVRIARASWWSRRIAANGVDRRAAERTLRTRRVSLEVFVVVLAVAAIVAIRTRGLLQGATVGIDPLLAAAPLLLAAVMAIVLVRIYPVVVRAIAATVGRSTGALGVLGAAQAQRALSALPVLALTLATALVICGGLLINTVASGQRDASWTSVGADARVTAAVSDDEVERLAAGPGVTAAGSFLSTPGIGLTGAPATSFITLVAVGAGYADVVAGLSGTPAAGNRDDADRLRSLAKVSKSERLPVLVDPQLADRLGDSKDLVITVGGTNVEVEIAGIVSAGPGSLNGPALFADRSQLASRLEAPLVADTTLVLGPGAERAARSIPGGAVLTRAQWIRDQQHEVLVAGVHRVMLASTASVALLAVISLIAGVIAGTRMRARSLALLRTLGMASRLGWWLAAAETAPVVVASLCGGILSGIGVVVLLGPSLGLASLAGGTGSPAPSLSPSVVIAVLGAGVGLLLIAVAVEVAAHRRDRLSEVLRVGETI
ncbi:MAG: hypothetical protein ABJA94_07125 [Rhodoglobus sp.]